MSWTNLGQWWRTGKPSELQSMASQSQTNLVIWLVEARDTISILQCKQQPPITKNYLAPNLHRVRWKTLWYCCQNKESKVLKLMFCLSKMDIWDNKTVIWEKEKSFRCYRQLPLGCTNWDINYKINLIISLGSGLKEGTILSILFLSQQMALKAKLRNIHLVRGLNNRDFKTGCVCVSIQLLTYIWAS